MKRSFGFLALVLGLLGLAPRLAAQYYYSTVASASLDSTGPFIPGQTVTIHFTLNEGTYPAKTVNFLFNDTIRKIRRSVIASDPSTGVASVTIDTEWPNGAYELTDILIDDTQGESVRYTPDGKIRENSHEWFYPAAGPVPDLRGLTFTVSGAIATIIRPTLTGFTRTSAATLAAGDRITWDYTVAPGTSVDWTLHISIHTPDKVTISPPLISGSGPVSGTITIPTTTGWVNGAYTVTASVYDNCSSSTYTPSAEGVISPESGFGLTGGLDEPVFPQISDVRMSSSGPFGPDETITIQCTFSGPSPITLCCLSYLGPDSMLYQPTLRVYANQDGIATVKVTRSMFDGSYWLHAVDLVDATGHKVNYRSSGEYLEVYGTGRRVKIRDRSFQIAGALTYPPVISAQPVGGTVQPGGTLTLRVATTGPCGFVQWYQGLPGDTSVPSGTGWECTPRPSSATATYWVRLTNQYGTVDSEAATITVSYSSPLPVILTQPGSIRTFDGSGGSLSVFAVGPPPLSYQWQKDGAPISGATNATLDFRLGRVADNGSYRVVVSNANGSATSESVSVVFVGQPQILQQPASAVVACGGSASFTVTAIGGDLRYWWSFEGQANYSSALYPRDLATLTLGNVQPFHAGTYTVTVQNGAGGITSIPVTLTVTDVPPPEFGPIETQYTGVGKDFWLEVRATHYPVHYIATGLPPGISVNDYGYLSGTPTVSGTFDVTLSATNAGGTGSRTFTMNVAASAYGPIITQQPVSQTAALHTGVTLSVVAVGTPSNYLGLNYQWYRNGSPLIGATSATYSIYADSEAKSGDYTVTVWGAAGSATSAIAHVVIDPSISAPYTTSLWSDQTIDAGSSLTLEALVSGTEAMTYQWEKDGALIDGATAETYIIDNASQADAGRYWVRAWNAYGAMTFVRSNVSVAYNVEPASITIRAGQTATLSLPASSAVTYQWYEGRTGDMSKPIMGATQATYTTPVLGLSTSYWAGVNGGSMTFSSTADVLVSNTDYSGTYFGTFALGGNWAMQVRADNTGTFLAYRTPSGEAVIGTVVVNADGSFTVTPIESRSGTSASARRVSASIQAEVAGLWGQIIDGQVGGGSSGLLGNLDTGTHAVMAAGTYSAGAVGAASGVANIIVGPSGSSFVIITSPTGVEALTGSLDTNGKIVGPTSAGTDVTVAIDIGKQDVSVTAVSSTGTSSFFGLAAGAANTSRLVNLSARAPVSGGDNVTIVGFGFTGPAPKNLLIRGVGPSLPTVGVTRYLAAPALALHDGRPSPFWSGGRCGEAADIITTATRVGAFPLLANAADCVYFGRLDEGIYTVVLSGEGDQTGIGVAEIYDADNPPTNTRLVNLSARARSAGGEDVLVAGFVIDGNGPATVLIRGIGPGLQALSISEFLPHPKLVLFDGDGKIVRSNTRWGGEAALRDAFARVAAFALDSNSDDTALLVTLAPGAYTVQLQTQETESGVGLIELYEMK